MRKLLIVLITLLLSPPAYADDFQDQVDAAIGKSDPAAVIKTLKDEAYRGNLKAAYQLGLFYRDGKIVPQNHATALKWLKTAAKSDWVRFRLKLGYDNAQYELGVMLRDGIGTSADAEDAAEWFEDAAKQGHSRAQSALAEMYLKGTGVSQDAKQAFFWVSLAASSLSGAELERAEATRKAAREKLSPEQISALEKTISEWYPRSL